MADRFHKPGTRALQGFKYKYDFWVRVLEQIAKRRRDLGSRFQPIKARTWRREYRQYHQRRVLEEREQHHG